MTTPVASNNYAQTFGTSSTGPFITIIMPRAPTGNDGPQQGLKVTQRWVDSSDNHTEYFLLSYISTGGIVQANWIQISAGSGTLETLTGNTGVASPVAGNINVVGSVPSGISTAGSGDTLTATLANIPNSSLTNSSITLVAGPGISITTSPVSLGGSTTISNTAAEVTWNLVTSNTQNLVPANGYVSDNVASLITYTLPSTAAFGSIIRITGINTGFGWIIQQNAGQQVLVGAMQTTVTTGSVASTDSTDSIELLCAKADLLFVALDWVGNLTVL